MSTTTPFALNTGSTIAGTTQVGDIAIGTNGTFDFSGDPGYGGVKWWMGPDEDTGYVIGIPDLNMSHPTPIGINAGVYFYRSNNFTDASFIGLVNNVARRKGQSDFTNITDALNWLSLSGFPTSYPVLGPELVTNGSFMDSITGWTNHATYTWDTAEWSSGRLHLVSNGVVESSNYQSCYQYVDLVGGCEYKILYTIDVISGIGRVLIENSPVGTEEGYSAIHYLGITNVDTIFTAATSITHVIDLFGLSSQSCECYIDNFSIKQIVGKYLPPILYDGNTFAWYDSSDLSTITKDGSNLVSEWRDKLGSGNDLLSSGGQMPTWSTDNGVMVRRKFMSTGAKTLDLPVVLYMVYTIPYDSGEYVGYFDGINMGTLLGIGYYSSTTFFVTGFGTWWAETYGVTKVAIHWNKPGNDYSYVNDGWIYHGGHYGGSPGGFQIGFGGPWGYYGHIDFKEIIIRKIADTAENRKDIYNYIANKYGLQTMLGPELIPNGTFTDASGWNLGGVGQFEITGGKLVCTCNDGYQAYTNDIGLVIGKTYRVMFTISDYVTGRIAPGVNYATGGHWVAADGTYSFNMVCDNNAYFSFLSWSTSAPGPFNGKIDNVSLKEVLL